MNQEQAYELAHRVVSDGPDVKVEEAKETATKLAHALIELSNDKVGGNSELAYMRGELDGYKSGVQDALIFTRIKPGGDGDGTQSETDSVESDTGQSGAPADEPAGTEILQTRPFPPGLAYSRGTLGVGSGCACAGIDRDAGGGGSGGASPVLSDAGYLC